MRYSHPAQMGLTGGKYVQYDLRLLVSKHYKYSFNEIIIYSPCVEKLPMDSHHNFVVSFKKKKKKKRWINFHLANEIPVQRIPDDDK